MLRNPDNQTLKSQIIVQTKHVLHSQTMGKINRSAESVCPENIQHRHVPDQEYGVLRISYLQFSSPKGLAFLQFHRPETIDIAVIIGQKHWRRGIFQVLEIRFIRQPLKINNGCLGIFSQESVDICHLVIFIVASHNQYALGLHPDQYVLRQVIYHVKS